MKKLLLIAMVAFTASVFAGEKGAEKKAEMAAKKTAKKAEMSAKKDMKKAAAAAKKEEKKK